MVSSQAGTTLAEYCTHIHTPSGLGLTNRDTLALLHHAALLSEQALLTARNTVTKTVVLLRGSTPCSMQAPGTEHDVASRYTPIAAVPTARSGEGGPLVNALAARSP